MTRGRRRQEAEREGPLSGRWRGCGEEKRNLEWLIGYLHICVRQATLTRQKIRDFPRASPPYSFYFLISTPVSTELLLLYFFFSLVFPPSPPLSKVRGINLLQLIALEHFIEQMHSSLLLLFPPLTLLFFLTPFFSPSSLLFFFPFASFPIPFLNQKKKTVTVYYPLIIMFPWHVFIVFTLRF